MFRQSTALVLNLAFIVALFFIGFACSPSQAQDAESTKVDFKLPQIGERLNDEQVAQFAQLALKGIASEYPNKPNDVLNDATEVMSPRELHPAFFGCFDWHSSVHMHWSLVRLLKQYPEHELANDIRTALATNLTKENLLQELAYFEKDHHKSFERTYGWAWYLRLVSELHTWDDSQGKQWREHLRPLEQLLVKRTIDYLPKLSYPVRTGIHPDSGFGLAFILDYARVVQNEKLDSMIVKRARDFYLNDQDYPTRYEPSGQDFFSSCLNEADLMRRVLDKDQFSKWLDKFLPGLKNGDGGNLLTPVEVSDVTDGYIVHLAGLDLSRAWCMRGIASALPDDDPRAVLLQQSAKEHAKTGFGYVFTGHYEGEHWLATFAIYLLSDAGLGK
jgi:hypothetical protein